MNGDELILSGPMSQLETDRWIQNMENNPIAGKDMTQHALECFERGALPGRGCTKPTMDGKE